MIGEKISKESIFPGFDFYLERYPVFKNRRIDLFTAPKKLRTFRLGLGNREKGPYGEDEIQPPVFRHMSLLSIVETKHVHQVISLVKTTKLIGFSRGDLDKHRT